MTDALAPTRPLSARPRARDRPRVPADAALGNRWDYYYARSKLGSDPLYPGVCDALRGSQRAVAGPGLRAGPARARAARRRHRAALPRRRQRRRQDRARAARRRRGGSCARSRSRPSTWPARLPTHRGSVAILDVLQFIAARRAGAHARRGDRDADARRAAGDPHRPGRRRPARAHHPRGRRVLARARLDERRAARYPDAEALRAKFDAAGLQAEFTPLYGNTPFNNWRVVVTKPE